MTVLPIIVFVGSPSNIQIHTGPVRNIKVMGRGLNVLDSDFNLRLREDHVDAVWVVRKPTSDGIVTSVELMRHGLVSMTWCSGFSSLRMSFATSLVFSALPI